MSSTSSRNHHHHPKQANKDKTDLLQTAAANEEGFYGVNESNPGRIVKLTYDLANLLRINCLLAHSSYASDGTCNHAITVFNRLVAV